MTELSKSELQLETEFNTLNEKWSNLNSYKEKWINDIRKNFQYERDLALIDARIAQFFENEVDLKNKVDLGNFMQTDFTTIKLSREMEIKYGTKVEELRKAAQSKMMKIDEEEINIPKRQMEIRSQLKNLDIQRGMYESQYNKYLFRQRMVQYGTLLANPTLGASEMGYNIYAQYNFQKNPQ